MRHGLESSVLAGVLALTVTVVGLGCSVQNRSVVNQPPELNRGLSTFSTEFGTIRPESMTVFLWPIQDEAQLTQTIAKVSRASLELDRLSIKLDALASEKSQFEADFAALECVVKWAVLKEGEDPELIVWVSEWKPDAPVACIENQNRRKELVKQIDVIGGQEQPAQVGQIYTALDPEYPTRVENMRSVNVKESRLVLAPTGEVAVTLKDFLRKGNAQSNQPGVSSSPLGDIHSVRYISQKKVLMFKVPEIDWIDGVATATGATWEFVLERAPDFLGRARFAGDIRVTKDGVTLRTGTAKIEGRLK